MTARWLERHSWCKPQRVHTERSEELLEAVPTLFLDRQATDLAARGVRRNLQKAGEPVRIADNLTAGIVLSQDATLLTRNRRHFVRVNGLRPAELSWQVVEKRDLSAPSRSWLGIQVRFSA